MCYAGTGAEFSAGVGARGVQGRTGSIREMRRSVIALAYRSLDRRSEGGREAVNTNTCIFHLHNLTAFGIVTIIRTV